MFNIIYVVVVMLSAIQKKISNQQGDHKISTLPKWIHHVQIDCITDAFRGGVRVLHSC